MRVLDPWIMYEEKEGESKPIVFGERLKLGILFSLSGQVTAGLP